MDEQPDLPQLDEAPGEPRDLLDAPRAAKLLPARAPEPGTLGSLSPPAFHLALFALTYASALLACLELEESTDGANLFPALGRAVAFATALIAILLSHEMGHFLLARKHRVDASWPYFLPAPYLSFVGTLGAVIRLRTLPRTRNALVDIGAAGPVAGFLVTLPVLALGVHFSKLVPNVPGESWSLWDSLVIWSRSGSFPEARNIGFGEPLLLQLFEYLRFGSVPDNMAIDLHPVLLAGWFGLFVTALNLLPLGQLDGGHILYAVSPKWHRILGAPFSAILVGLGVFTPFIGWLFWGVLTGTVLSRHPPLQKAEQPMSRERFAIAMVCLAIFVLCFTPVPLAMLT